MGALNLKPLDDAVEATGLFYARFMDDWGIVAPTRWKLCETIRIVNQALNMLKVEKHPDKTFIGRTDKGFDFLEYHFKPNVLMALYQTVKKHAERICQLYEQGADRHRIWKYVRRWTGWLRPDVSSSRANRALSAEIWVVVLGSNVTLISLNISFLKAYELFVVIY